MTSPAVKKLMDAARSARRYLGQLRGSPETRAVVMEYYHELDNAILAVEAEEAAPVYVPVAKLSAETMAAEPKWTVEDAIGWNKQWKADMLKPTDAPPPTDTVTFKIPAEVAAAMATEPARVADGEWCMPIPAEYVITDAMIEAAMDAIKPHGVNRDNMRAALAAALKAGRA